MRPRLCLARASRGSRFDSEAVRVCPQSVIKNTPAASIAPTALKTGWLRKEGKGNKAFKRRFFVLWSTPDAVARMVGTNHTARSCQFTTRAAVLKDGVVGCAGGVQGRECDAGRGGDGLLREAGLASTQGLCDGGGRRALCQAAKEEAEGSGALYARRPVRCHDAIMAVGTGGTDFLTSVFCAGTGRRRVRSSSWCSAPRTTTTSSTG